MVVYPKISLALESKRHASMLREGRVHVVEETNARRDIDNLLHTRSWGTVEVDVNLDLCFVGFARDGGLSGGHIGGSGDRANR